MTAKEFIGRSVSFQFAEARLVGVVTEAKDNGRTERGDIPDMLLTIRGASGKTLTVSRVEHHVELKEP